MQAAPKSMKMKVIINLSALNIMPKSTTVKKVRNN